MAKVILDSGDTFVAASNVTILGSTGSETVKVQDGVTATVDTSVERIEFTGASSAYTFKSTPTGVQVMSGTTVVANVANGNKLSFTDGSVSVAVGFSGGALTYTVGGATVTGTAATLTGATVNTAAAEKSTIVAGTGAVAGQTFTLTTGTDVKTLTAGNDTVDGSTTANSASGDVIADASTTDADVMNMKMTSTLTSKPTISNVETINAQFEGFGVSLDASGISNGTIVVSTATASQDKATITGLASNNANVQVSTGIANLVMDANAAGVGSATVKLAGGALALSSAATNLATLNLNSTGSSANTVTLTHNAAAMTVTGDQNLTIVGPIANFTTETLTNSLSSGKTLTMKNNTTLAAGADMSKVGATNYDLAADSGAQVVTFAAGTTAVALNHVTAHAATFTASGSGTADVLTVAANKVYGVGAFTTSGYENVNITDTAGAAQTLTSAVFTGATVALTGTQSYTFATAVTAKNLDASGLTGTGKLTVTDFTNSTATTSTITGTANNDSITVDNNAAEIINVITGEGANTVTAKTTATDTTILVVTAGSGSDTITGAAGNDTILGGSGNDTIDAKTGNNYVVAGDGNDTVTMSNTAAADAVLAGAGDDMIIGAAAVTVADTIVGGDGTDTLTLTDDTATTDLNNISGVEVITIVNTSASLYTTVDSLVAAGATLTVSQAAALALTFNGAAETDGKFDITVNGNAAHVITGGAGADAITATSTTAVAVVGGAGADTITLSGAAAHSVTGGAGADTIAFGSSVAGVAYITSLTDSTTTAYDSVSGYTGASETIDLATASLGLTFTVAGNVTAAAGTTNGIATGKFTFDKLAATSLTDAITKVGADVKTAGNAVVFTYGSDVYFFADTDGAATTTNDILVKLVGSTIGNLTAAGEVFTMA